MRIHFVAISFTHWTEIVKRKSRPLAVGLRGSFVFFAKKKAHYKQLPWVLFRLYLAFVIGLFFRQVIGWSMQSIGMQLNLKTVKIVFSYPYCYPIYHSGKLRVRQTAEEIASGLNLPAPVAIDGLDPRAEPSVWASRLQEASGSLMLVGHLPHLSRLAAVLLCGDVEKNPVLFHMGGIVSLKRENSLSGRCDGQSSRQFCHMGNSETYGVKP